MTVVERTERAYQLDLAAADLNYAARQLDKAAEYLRLKLEAQATDALNRACEGFDRAGAVLCPEEEMQ